MARCVDITGVGFISGVNGWRDLDFDKCPDFAPVAQALAALGLPADYPWVQRTGSGNGWQIIFVCQAELPAGVLTAKAQEPGCSSARVGTAGSITWNCAGPTASCSYHPPNMRAAASISGGGGADRAAGRGEQRASVGGLPGAGRAAQPRARSQQSTRRYVPAPPKHSEPDDRQIIDAIHERFDLLAYARQHFPGEQLHEGDEVASPATAACCSNRKKASGSAIGDHRRRLAGSGGLPERGIQWDRQDKVMFRAALREAAAFAGVSLARGNSRRGGTGRRARRPRRRTRLSAATGRGGRRPPHRRQAQE